jgi:hypothetical protein
MSQTQKKIHLFEEFKIENQFMIRGGMNIEYHRSRRVDADGNPGPVSDDVGLTYEGDQYQGRDYWRDHDMVVQVNDQVSMADIEKMTEGVELVP